MKPPTLLIASCAFVAGLGLGLSGPVAKAGDGLLHILLDGAPHQLHADRITASAGMLRRGFQAADFQWQTRSKPLDKAFCAPKDELSNMRLPAIQHL